MSLKALSVAWVVFVCACGGGAGVAGGDDRVGDDDQTRDEDNTNSDGGPLHTEVLDTGVDEPPEPPFTTARVHYRETRTHSPITSAIAANLVAIKNANADRHEDMFMKVGDAISASPLNMACFLNPADVDFAGRDGLADTAQFYRQANTSTSFGRQGHTAVDGWTAAEPLAGAPSPFEQEDDAIKPRVALVQFGTNDAATIVSSATTGGFASFYENLNAIADAMIARGTVPVFITIPSVGGARNVPTMNAIIRAVAQSRGVPLVDFHREAHEDLAYGSMPCFFTAAYLGYGGNVRNLLQMQALDRVHTVLDSGAALSDETGLTGSGTAAEPFVVGALPFSDHDDARAATVHYTLNVAAAGRLRILALTRLGSAAATVTLTGGDARSVIATTMLHAPVAAGDFTVMLSGAAYGLAIVMCEKGDATCDPIDDGNDDPTETGVEEPPEPPFTTARPRYRASRTHSPITAPVAASLLAIKAANADRNENMFMKVGDSITESFLNMACLEDVADVDLGGRGALADTAALYRTANVSGPGPCAESWCMGATNAYDRASYAAGGGWTAAQPLEGDPPALEREDAVVRARIAVVEYGTNDATVITSNADLGRFSSFYTNLNAIADELAAKGTVPVFMTIPPYDPGRNGALNVPTMNAIVRLVAQSRAVPLVDFNRETLALPGWGLWDGVHPEYGFEPCHFTSEYLPRYAGNVRNLLQLQALDRVLTVLGSGQALSAPTGIDGAGSSGDPFVIDGLPFVDSDDATVTAVHYRLALAGSQRLRFFAPTRSGVATIGVTGLGDASYVEAATIMQATLGPGDFDVAIDGAAYGLVVIACQAGDVTCD